MTVENEEVICVENLVRDYTSYKKFFRKTKISTRAVNDVSFRVFKGEIFGLLGQNGAGKSTIIKILTTLLAPTGGVCKVLGFNTFGEEKHIRGRINFVFGGELGVYRRLSARDNLKYFANLYMLEPQVRDSTIESVLKLVGLSQRADEAVETYSKGMIQRLQIARGLINDPEILFLDEPTIGLDPLGARMLKDLIRQLKEEGKTILITSHNLTEIEELCDRLLIINYGKVLKTGTPDAIKVGFSSLEEAYVSLIGENND